MRRAVLPAVAAAGAYATVLLAEPDATDEVIEATTELTEWIVEDGLGPEGRKRGVVVAATSDAPTPTRTLLVPSAALPQVVNATLSGESGGGNVRAIVTAAGMSGSPVYIDGKLIGAVSYSLGNFPKEPIAGITPIAEMIDATALQTTRPVGARDQPLHPVAAVGVDDRKQELARRVVRAGAKLGQRTRQPLGLKTCEFHRELFALGRNVEKPLAAVVLALLLKDVAFVDELLEHPSQRLLGDLQHVEQIGDLHPRIPVDEMQHPVVRPAEVEAGQHIVRIADETFVPFFLAVVTSAVFAALLLHLHWLTGIGIACGTVLTAMIFWPRTGLGQRREVPRG